MSNNNDAAISVFINNGDSTFAAGVPYAVPDFPFAITVKD